MIPSVASLVMLAVTIAAAEFPLNATSKCPRSSCSRKTKCGLLPKADPGLVTWQAAGSSAERRPRTSRTMMGLAQREPPLLAVRAALSMISSAVGSFGHPPLGLRRYQAGLQPRRGAGWPHALIYWIFPRLSTPVGYSISASDKGML